MVWRCACAHMIFPVETPPMEGGEYATFLMPRIGTVRRLSFSSSPQIGGSVLDPHPHTPGTLALDPSGYIYILLTILYYYNVPLVPCRPLLCDSCLLPIHTSLSFVCRSTARSQAGLSLSLPAHNPQRSLVVFGRLRHRNRGGER